MSAISTKSTKKQKRRIAILDSGVGGLSIALPYAKYLAEHVPSSKADSKEAALTIDYLADTGFFPYGTKPKEQLINRVTALVSAYLDRHPDCEQLIIACNTASTLCLAALREAFELPIIGVVPALKPACELSAKPTVGLLATVATIDRRYVDELMKQFGQGKELIKVGSQNLVQLAEQQLRSGATIEHADQLVQKVSSDLEPFRKALLADRLDTIVLGCTHFPWLRQTIADLLSDNLHSPMRLLDSTAAIIRRSLDLLGESSLLLGLDNPSLSLVPRITSNNDECSKSFAACYHTSAPDSKDIALLSQIFGHTSYLAVKP